MIKWQKSKTCGVNGLGDWWPVNLLPKINRGGFCGFVTVIVGLTLLFQVIVW